MYKYLSRERDLQEMTVRVKSLPTCSIVLDSKANLVDINQPALSFFKIETVNDYRFKRWQALNDKQYFQRIILELMTERSISGRGILIKCPDYSYAVIYYGACMISCESAIFLFQFFESSTLSGLSIDYLDKNRDESIRDISKKNRMHDAWELSATQEAKQEIIHRYLDSTEIQLLSERYPTLLYMEIIVCRLIILGLSTSEMITITNKKQSYIRSVLYRLFRYFKLNSQKRLYLTLTETENVF